AVCRGWSRPASGCRGSSGARISCGKVASDRSRQVAAGRGWSYLFDIGDMLHDRCRRDQVLLAVSRLDAMAVEMAFGAIALDGTDRAGKPAALVERGGILDR